jgi:nucleotide-binding universal stress UspA family protein
MNVLWPVDAARSSAAPIEAISAQCPPEGTVLRLLAVVEPIAPPVITLWHDGGGSLERVLELREEHARGALRDLAECLTARGFTVESVVRRGSARRHISREAREWPAALVLLTVPEREGFVRRLFGGTAMRLAHRAACAVEIVRVTAASGGPAAATPSGLPLRWWTHRTEE